MDTFGTYDEYHLALIGDVRGSRAHPDRAALQRRLKEALETANREHTPSVPLAITAGDEFQGLLAPERAGLAVDLLVELGERLHPVELAFGLGWGTLATPRGATTSVSELDGPCFHRARNALDRAKTDSTWAALEGFGPALDGLVTGTFGLMAVIRGGWTGKQAVYVRDARHAERYKDVAERHSVVPSVITESLQSAHFKALLRAEDGLRLALAALAGGGTGFGAAREPGRDSLK